MKKYFAVLGLLISMVFLFTACGSSESVEADVVTFQYEDKEYIIDFESSKVTSGDEVINFVLKLPSEGGYFCKLTYPNGATYSQNLKEVKFPKVISRSRSGNQSEYIPGEVLVGKIVAVKGFHEFPVELSVKLPVVLILFVMGIWNLIAPRGVWYVSHGWRYKNAEPSKSALILNRVVGGVVILFAVIWLFA